MRLIVCYIGTYNVASYAMMRFCVCMTHSRRVRVKVVRVLATQTFGMPQFVYGNAFFYLPYFFAQYLDRAQHKKKSYIRTFFELHIKRV